MFSLNKRMNFSKIETEKMLTFAACRANRTTVPLPIMDLWREYIKLGMTDRSLISLCNKFRKLTEDLHNNEQMSFETKLKIMFAFSAPVHKDFIGIIEENADFLQISPKNVILEYKSANLNLTVKNKHEVRKKMELATPTSSSVAPVDVMDVLRPLRRIITILRSIKLHKLLHAVVNAINLERHKNIPISIVEMALKNVFAVAHFPIGDQESTMSLKYFLKIFRTMILEINLQELYELQKSVEAAIQKAQKKDKKIPTVNIAMGLEAAFTLVYHGQYYSLNEMKKVENVVKNEEIEEVEDVKPQIPMLDALKCEAPDDLE